MYRTLTGAAVMLTIAVLLVTGCGSRSNRQTSQRSNQPSSKVAGTREQASTVNATITNNGLQLTPTSVPAGTVMLNITNNTNKAQTISVSREYAATRTQMIQPGKTSTMTLQNVKQGSYNITVQGQTGASFAQKLTVTGKRATGTTTGQASTIAATLTNTGMRLDRTRVPAGNVTVNITNNTTKAQTVMVSGPNKFQKSQTVQPNQTATMTLPNVRQGSYRFSVKGETAQGFKRTLTVTPQKGQMTSQAQQSTVAGTITNSGLQLTPSQVPVGNVTMHITNDTTVAKTVEITGPGNTRKSLTIQPNQTASTTVNNVQQGSYTVAVQGQTGTAYSKKLTVSSSGVAGSQEKMATMTFTVTESRFSMSPGSVAAGNTNINIINKGKKPVKFTMANTAGSASSKGGTTTLQPGQTVTMQIMKTAADTYQVSFPAKQSSSTSSTRK